MAKFNKILWTLNANSESGDEYYSIAIFDKKPTNEEVFAELVQRFGDGEVEKTESEDEALDFPMSFFYDGQWYGSYLYWRIDCNG